MGRKYKYILDKKKAIRIITNAAESYHNNLEDQKVLFVFGVPTEIKRQLKMKTRILSGLSCYEVTFHRSNFMHLTGVKIHGEEVASSINFYQKCLDHRLSESDFELSTDGATEQKLDVIEQMMKIKKNVAMIGDFTDRGPKLYSEKVAGNVCACIGFVKDKYTKYNVPNTLLKKDIRDVCTKPQQKIYMVFSKKYNADKYEKIEKLYKSIDWKKVILPETIQNKIEISNIDCLVYP